jgi:hypothetical protein
MTFVNRRSGRGHQYEEQAARFGLVQQIEYVIGTKDRLVGSEYHRILDIITKREEWAQSEMKVLCDVCVNQTPNITHYRNKSNN